MKHACNNQNTHKVVNIIINSSSCRVEIFFFFSKQWLSAFAHTIHALIGRIIIHVDIYTQSTVTGRVYLGLSKGLSNITCTFSIVIHHPSTIKSNFPDKFKFDHWLFATFIGSPFCFFFTSHIFVHVHIASTTWPCKLFSFLSIS